MNLKQDPQAAIYLEEEHHYDVDLGAVPYISWRDAQGSLRIEIPYDGAVLKQDSSDIPEEYNLGELHIVNTADNVSERLPIALKAGGNWHAYIKSNRKSVCRAKYAITEPSDTLLSIDGIVVDNLLDEAHHASADGINIAEEAFNNPLALRLSLWVPDLLAQSRPGEVYELETMLVRQENTRLAFMSGITTLNFEQRLAENLTALANTAGGIILLGVERSGHVTGVDEGGPARQSLMRSVLGAALLSAPPVPLWRLIYVSHSSGRTVARIEVPASESVQHQVSGRIYKRQGRNNITEEQPARAKTNQSLLHTLPDTHFEDVFNRSEAGGITFKSREDVAVCNGSEGLRNVRLGAYICGLINAGKRIGRIIVTDLPQPRRGRLTALVDTTENFDAILKQELSKITPRLDMPYVERRHLGDQQIAIVHLPTWQIPIALYEGQGYIWQNLSLKEFKIEELFDTYLDLTGSRVDVFDDQDVYLDQAMLNWPIRPPERLHKSGNHEAEGLTYDIEYQAQVWTPRSFKRDEDTVGFVRELTIPLPHVSLTMDDEGRVITKAPVVEGTIRIRLNDVLASGLEATPEANEENGWLNTIPIIKRTYLHLHVTASLNELFKRRTKSSLLRFFVPDVLLTQERVADIAQVCADVGFRVYEEALYESSPIKATIRGIRSHGYHDIFLLIGLVCERSELQRELHYDGWRDSKSTFTAMLDVRALLWGTGEGVEDEIGRLHIQLYQTINQRLLYLRTE
jgi:predicted HTH transcriptional regulator